MEIINRNNAGCFVTKDMSQIREILSPRNSSLRNQSLAEATVAPGQSTESHHHPLAEEVYYVLSGRGRMQIEDESKEIGEGDGIVILPGKCHHVWNIGDEDLVFLCCCAPAYTHEDTLIT